MNVSVEKMDSDEGDTMDTSRKRKREVPVSPDPSPDRSSPLKRIQNQTMDMLHDAEDEKTNSQDELDEDDSSTEGEPIDSKLGGRSAWFMNREIGGQNRPRVTQVSCYGSGN